VTAWGRRGRVHTWSTSLAPLRYDRTYSQPQPAAGPCCIALRAAQWNTVRVVYMLRCPEDLLLGHAPQSQGHCVVVVSEGAGVVPLPPPAHRQTTDQPTVAVCDVRLLTLLPYTAVLCCTVLYCAVRPPYRELPHCTTPHHTALRAAYLARLVRAGFDLLGTLQSNQSLDQASQVGRRRCQRLSRVL
jgi:hypothetical protein